MIETLLEAERAISYGLIDQAEGLYRQVAERDPKNAIAVVGLARVALERGDERTAYLEARRALAIDPENPAAQHLAMRLAEVMEGRGETVPEPGEVAATPAPSAARNPEPASERGTPSASAATVPANRKRRGLFDRLLGRKR